MQARCHNYVAVRWPLLAFPMRKRPVALSARHRTGQQCGLLSQPTAPLSYQEGARHERARGSVTAANATLAGTAATTTGLRNCDAATARLWRAVLSGARPPPGQGRAAWPHLPTGGAIINTASIQAYQPSPSLLAYASTKGAIVTFTKALAQEGMQRGIRVNAVAPGPVWTPLIPATMPAEQVAQFGQQTPVGRPAQPAELAPLYVFLASEEASYIAGEVVGVTGGKPLA